MTVDETHRPELRSWLESANARGGDFPIQNLPFGVFSRAGEAPRCGIAIGEAIVDVAKLAPLFTGLARAAALACAEPQLNALMAHGGAARKALRTAVSQHLTDATLRAHVEPHLVPMAGARLHLPVRIPNYTDFYSSIHHATNVGRIFRPDNPLLPNYKWVPIAYHGRVSSIRVSGTDVRRPKGQIKLPDAPAPTFAPSRSLDYELELGFYVGEANALGEPVPIGEADGRIWGFSLLNDWSARDIQAWEYQPLGPFLAKNFATTVSPWVVTPEALAPFRTPAPTRPEGDPAPLPYLTGGGEAYDIRVEAYLVTRAMVQHGHAPCRLSHAGFAGNYWTPAQMLAHHTSNGCNLEIGDLFGTGTISGPGPGEGGSLIELTRRGAEPIALPSGETRRFLEDGDTVILRAHCERAGFAGIGFGECRATVLAS